MDKQKIDLDQLYQERFQSFEMEPSTGAMTSMMQKLKWAKTISMVKWIAGGILITAAAVTITLFSINNNENELAPNNTEEPKTENKQNEITITSHEDDNALNNKTENTLEIHHTKEIGEEKTINKEQNNSSEIQPKEEEVENNSPLLIEKETKPKADKIPTEILVAVEQAELNEFKNRRESLKMLTYKYATLDIPDNSLSINRKNLNPTKKLGASKAKVKGNKKAGFISNSSLPNGENKASLFDGYFDVHFAPLAWQNNAKISLPALDTSWTSSFNHSPNLSYEFGISFQLHHQKLPVFLQLGADYQVLKEKVDFQMSRTFEDPNLSYWTYDSIYDYQEVLDTFYIIIDDNQFVIDSIFTTDTVLADIDSLYNPVNSTETRNKNHLNTYRYLNIPLLLGYQFESRNQKWSYQLMAGPAVSINLKNDGFYYTNSGSFQEYSGKMSPSLVWNFYAAANINYRWKKWQFYAQPEFQYQLNESELSNQFPRRKYQFYKLKVGIRYQLF